MSFRIQRPESAFSNDPRSSKSKRKPRVEMPSHLAWIRTLPCVVTGRIGSDPAHISYGDSCYGKTPRGLGEKASDIWVVPLCRSEHEKQHSMRETAYWQTVGIDPCRIAAALWAISGDDEAAILIIKEARSIPIAGIRKGNQ